MKHIFLSILFLFFTFCVNAQGQETIQAPGDFEFNTSYNFGNVAKHTQSYPGSTISDRITTYRYNEEEQLISTMYDRDEDGIGDSYSVYTYNEVGLLAKRELRLQEFGVSYYVFTYEYDSNDSLVFQKDSSLSGVNTITYTYNAQGLKTKRIYEGPGFSGLITWVYDEDSRVVIEANGEIGQPATFFRLYTYNSSGLLTKERHATDLNGTAIRVIDYSYDAQGRLVQKLEDVGNDGIWVIKHTYAYDEQSRLIQTLKDSDTDGTYDLKYSKEYDSKGNLISDETYDMPGNTYRSGSRYAYDVNGNMTRRAFIDKNMTESEVDVYSFSNSYECSNAGAGLSHKLLVNIPQDGRWRMQLCGASFQNRLVLSAVDFCLKDIGESESGCPSGDARLDVNLTVGDYYLTVVGKGLTDDGLYKLAIGRLSSASIPDNSVSELSAYPNPASDYLTINRAHTAGTIVITSMLGEECQKQNFTRRVDVKTLNPGLYFISLLDGDKVYQTKFIKK